MTISWRSTLRMTQLRPRSRSGRRSSRETPEQRTAHLDHVKNMKYMAGATGGAVKRAGMVTQENE